MFGTPSTQSGRIRRSTLGVDARLVREAFARALSGRHLKHALSLVLQLEALEPNDPRWPHKRGDILRVNREPERAAEAYLRAARLYDENHLKACANAMLVVSRSLGGKSTLEGASGVASESHPMMRS